MQNTRSRVILVNGDRACSTCGCSSQTPQDGSLYQSHVQIRHTARNQGVWSIGNQLIIKDRADRVPTNENRNIQLIRDNTKIPVPTVFANWDESDGTQFTVLSRIAGTPLDQAWPTLSTEAKEHIAWQTHVSIAQMRDMTDKALQRPDGEPLYSAYLFQTRGTGYGIPHGPLHSDDELWEEMLPGLEGLPEHVHEELRAQMPPAQPYTFSHCNLDMKNILVHKEGLAGILDWENTAFFPVWWEYVALKRTGVTEPQAEWSRLVLQHMDKYEDAWRFWSAYSDKCRAPRV